MIIRRLRPDDAAAFKELRRDAVQDSPHSFYPNVDEVNDTPIGEFCAQLQQSEYSYVFGTFKENELVSIIGLRRDARAKVRHKANIWGVYTRPEHRGQGIARRMMETALETARSIPGIALVTLGVHTENTAAKALYTSFGFDTFGVERNSMHVNGHYVHEEHMMLEFK